MFHRNHRQSPKSLFNFKIGVKGVGLVDVISLEVFFLSYSMNQNKPMIKNVLQRKGDCHLLHLRKCCLHDKVGETGIPTFRDE